MRKLAHFAMNLVLIMVVISLPGCAAVASMVGAVAKSEYSEFAVQVKREIDAAKADAITVATGRASEQSGQDAGVAAVIAIASRYGLKIVESKMGKKKSSTS